MEEKHTIKIELEFDLFEQLPPHIWKQITLHLADYECEECDNKENLKAHHIDQNRKNNTIVNGRCLCASCHQRTHVKLRADLVLLSYVLAKHGHEAK